MTDLSERNSLSLVVADPRETAKAAATFFAEMPWDGPSFSDPGQWSASQFFELLCDGEPSSAERLSRSEDSKKGQPLGDR